MGKKKKPMDEHRKLQARELKIFYDLVQEMKHKYENPPLLWMGDLNAGVKSRFIEKLKNGKVGSHSVIAVDDLSQAEDYTNMGGHIIDFVFGEKGKFVRIAG